MTALSPAIESISEFVQRDRLILRWRRLRSQKGCGTDRETTPLLMIAMVLIVLIAIACSLIYTVRQDRDVSRKFAATSRLYQDQVQRIGELERLQEQEGMFAAQAALDASLVDTFPRSRALAEVTNALTPGVRLVDVWLGQGSSGAPASLLKIGGIALSDAEVYQFLSSLSKSPWVHQLKMIASDSGGALGIGPRKFQLTAVLDRSAGASLSSTN